MALKTALVSGYVGQIYVLLIGILMMPMYLHYLGPEAYGLVGFFVVFQAWLQLLDFGLTPTLSRELSQFRAGALASREAWHLVRSAEWIFAALAIVCAGVVALSSAWIATQWLRPERLAQSEITASLTFMGVIAGLRWLTGLYRSGLIGLEKQVSVNAATVVLATAKSGAVLLVLAWVSNTPRAFFVYQCCIAVLEMLIFQRMFYHAMPVGFPGVWPKWMALHRVWRFAGSMAFMAGIWIAITQLDKLILSHFLSLKDYGYFMLAVAAANVVSAFSGPLNQALQPRFTVLTAQKRDTELMKLYSTSTQLAVALMAGLAGPMALFAQPLIMAWTGNAEAAHQAAPILFWYALGNGIVGLLSIPFMLQYAYGNLRLHMIGNAVFVIMWLPALIYAANKFGAVGAGQTWLAGNLLFLVGWVPYVHSRIAPQLKWSWIIRDVGAVVAAAGVVLFLLSFVNLSLMTRFWVILFVAFACLLVSGVGAFAGDKGRNSLLTIHARPR